MSPLFSHLVSRSGSALTQRTTLTFARTSTRAASTEAKESAANKGSELSQKAAQGWSQAVKAAGPAAQGAVQSLKKLGGPAGKVVSFVEGGYTWTDDGKEEKRERKKKKKKEGRQG